MIHSKGDVIIDEIDQTLDPKDLLIYTTKDGVSIDKKYLAVLVNLFRFIKIPSNATRSELNQILAALPQRLIDESDSPIADIIGALTTDQKSTLVLYFHNQTIDIPDFVLNFDDQRKDIIAMIKEEITRFLSTTEIKIENVHYGLPKDPAKSSIEREIAIPYLGNNVPNETSEFHQIFITLNHTTKIQLKNSIPREVIQSFITDFQNRMEMETIMRLHLGTSQVLSTAAELEFSKLVKDDILQLRDIEISNEKDFNQIYELIKDNHSVKDYCLINYILNTIINNPESLEADPQNHIEIYNSAIGFTGTDYNYRTFHRSIINDKEESHGTDGQTLYHLVNSKNKNIHVLHDSNQSTFFDFIKANVHRTSIRAIIDCGAQFHGIPNREVANVLSAVLSSTKMKFVLYFNEKNVLCALPVTRNPHNTKPIILASSENIATRLGCSTADYFAYYDHIHTTGVDIKLAPNTIGLLTFNEHASLRDLLQSAMRLRDLKATQQIEFVIMYSLANIHSAFKSSDWSVEKILNIALMTQANLLMKMHLSSAYQKIHNIFKIDLLKRIINTHSFEDKVYLMQHFSPIIFDDSDKRIFDQFGNVIKQVETPDLLKQYYESQKAIWLKCLRNAQMNDIDLKNADDTFSLIFKQATEICAKHQLSTVTPTSNNAEDAIHEGKRRRKRRKKKKREKNRI